MSAFIIKLLKKQAPIIYGTGQKKRDFIYVDDVNDFHLRCIQDDRTNNQTYNLGSGKNQSVLEIYHLIEGMLKTGIAPIFKDDLPGESQLTLADITKAKAVGWEPKVSIQQGLKKSMEYIQEKVIGEVKP
jgi:UDP-glucose 4-epimerase